MKNSPIIVLIDMDCFYVQVELKAAIEYIGKETAVVQYNSWRGGGIIAVSYEARAKGVNRSMRGDDAKQKCPNIHLFRVPELRGKADLTKYRNAGADVIKSLTKHAARVERASIDEAYIDLTDEVDNLLVAAPDSPEMMMFWDKNRHSTGCHVIGFDSYDHWLDHISQFKGMEEFSDDLRLALGAFLVQKMREDIYTSLGYRCSAGIGHSKMIAKYACGVHKPNQQTLVPSQHVMELLRNAPIEKIRNLGGKMGTFVQEELNISLMGQLSNFSLNELTDKFGNRTGPWLYYLCRGQDDESVLSRQLAQSIGCSKTFPGAKQLNTIDQVSYWLDQMAHEIADRVEEDSRNNARLPTHLCLTYRQVIFTDGQEKCHHRNRSCSGSKVVPLTGLTMSAISTSAFVVLSSVNSAEQRDLPINSWYPPLLSLGLSAGKFRPQLAKNDISRFLIDVPMKQYPGSTKEDNLDPIVSTSTWDINYEEGDLSPTVCSSTSNSPMKPFNTMQSIIKLEEDNLTSKIGDLPFEVFTSINEEPMTQSIGSLEFDTIQSNIKCEGVNLTPVASKLTSNIKGKGGHMTPVASKLTSNIKDKGGNLTPVASKLTSNIKGKGGHMTPVASKLTSNIKGKGGHMTPVASKLTSNIKSKGGHMTPVASKLTSNIKDKGGKMTPVANKLTSNIKGKDSKMTASTSSKLINQSNGSLKSNTIQSNIKCDEGNCLPIFRASTSNDAEHSSIITTPQLELLNVRSDDFIINKQSVIKQSDKKKGFFARLREQEELETFDNCSNSIMSEVSIVSEISETSFSNEDFYTCDQCGKRIVMWEAPEHCDWHVAKTLQKQLSQEIYDEDAKLREKKKIVNQNGHLKRKADTNKPNQLTIDRFFTK